jgi:hypothetical protein
MYCQTCGTEIQTGLNYCNRCGAMVNSSLSSVAATKAETAVVDIKSPVRTLGFTITFTTLLGLVILFAAIGGLASAERQLPADLLGVLGVVGLLMILIIDVMLIRILARVVQLPVAAAAPSLPAQIKRAEAKELHPQAAQTYMPASTDPLPVASVTDHTTRTFHPVYKEPRANS